MAITKSIDVEVRSLADDGPGDFEMILSDDSTDRQGENLWTYLWRDPLPDRIPLNLNHSTDAADIVASGTPSIESDGSLRVRGTFASTPAAQHVRQLVREGHLTSVSVEFLRHKDGSHELTGGAFVTTPANARARILSAKSLNSSGGTVMSTTADHKAAQPNPRLEAMRLAADQAYKDFAAGKIDVKAFEAVMDRVEKDAEAERVAEKTRRKALEYAGSADSDEFHATNGGLGAVKAARRNRFYQPSAGDSWCATPSLMSATAQEGWTELFAACKSRMPYSVVFESAQHDGPRQPRMKAITTDLSVKAVGEGVAGAGGSLLPAILVPDAFAERLEEDRAFSHFPGIRTEGEWVQYLQHTSDGNPAAPVAELGTIPDLEPNITPNNVVFTKIAGRCSFSNELLKDDSTFMSFAPSELARKLYDAESDFVLNNSDVSDGWSYGLVNTPGIQTVNASLFDSPIDAVVAAAADIRVATSSFGHADLIITHPYTALALRTLKAGTGFGLYVLDQNNPNALGQETFTSLFGMKLVQTTKIAAGKALVTDSSISTLAFTRQGIEVQSNWQGDTEWTTDSWSFRAIERIGIGVIWPQAIALVSNLPVVSGFSS